MTSVRRALFFSLLERHLLIVLAVASNMILARLLTPEQVGIYSVSLAVIGVARVLLDFCVDDFLTREKELFKDRVCAAIPISLIDGGLLMRANCLGRAAERRLVRSSISCAVSGSLQPTQGWHGSPRRGSQFWNGQPT